MKKKTIFIISQKLNGGGAERVASNLSQELSENDNYKVYLVLFDGSNQTYPSGAEIIDMRLKPQSGLIGKGILFLRRIISLKSLKKKYKPDISISLLTSPNIINVLSRVNDKIVVSIRNHLSKSETGRLQKKIINFTCKHADITVSLSELVKYDLIDNFGAPSDKVKTIYNTCDAKKLIELSDQEGVEIPGYRYVVTMGRLMRQKGQWHLIKAFKMIHKEMPDLHLVILGEGELENGLLKLAEGLNIGNYVHLFGYVKNPHNIIRNSEAFLFTSLFEGLGNVILEAMACGVPVVSADCQAGPREILSEDKDKESLSKKINEAEFAEYGILTPAFPSDEDPNFECVEITNEERIFAQTVITLLENYDITDHYRRKSLERIKVFSKESIMAQWNELIEKL